MGVEIGSNNPYPSVLLAEQGATPADPPATEHRLFVRASDHVLCLVDSAGVVTEVAAGGVVGIPVGGATDQRLAKASGADFDVAWVTPADTGIDLAGDSGSASSISSVTFTGADVTDDGGGAATVAVTGGGGGGATSPLHGADVSGHVGGTVTFEDSTGSVGGKANLQAGNTQSDRPGGFVHALPGTAVYGGVEMGVGGGGRSMLWDTNGLTFQHPGPVAFTNDEGDLTFRLLPYGGSTLILDVPRLPVADPHVVGRVWNNGGALTVSAG